MISRDACNAIVSDLHNVIVRNSDDFTEWEAVAFMLAYVMRQMSELSDDERMTVSTYAAGVACSMHEDVRRLN